MKETLSALRGLKQELEVTHSRVKRWAILAALLLAPAMAGAQGIATPPGGGVADPLIVADVQGTTSVCVLGPTDTANSVCLLSNEIRFEGAADGFEGSLVAPSITADWTWTLPSGTTTLAGLGVAGTWTAAQTLQTDKRWEIGSTSLGTIAAITAKTPDSPTLHTGTTANSWHINEWGDVNFDFQNCDAGTGAYADPTLVGHSANQSTTECWWLTHNQTDFVVGTLTGGVRVDAPDGLILEDAGSKPTCDSSIRGAIWYDAGGAGVADTIEVCAKDSADSYAWTVLATIS